MIHAHRDTHTHTHLFPTKPSQFPTTTPTLPMDRVSASTSASVAGLESRPRTTSTRRIKYA